MRDIKKSISIIEDQEFENDQLFEMANITDRYHGIDNVVIWVGMAPKQHELRVKVSNLPNKMSMDDCFVIQMPSLDYDPQQVASWISTKTLRNIMVWIKLNQPLLYDYELCNITDTGLFLEKISAIAS